MPSTRSRRGRSRSAASRPGTGGNSQSGRADDGPHSNGALIEKEVAGQLDDEMNLTLELRNPDFTTAVRIADAINRFSKKKYGTAVAKENDLKTVSLLRPANVGAARFLAEIGELMTEADSPARVVVDERTGTVVMGQDVQVSTVAVTHGNLTVRITEQPKVSQPSRSRTARRSRFRTRSFPSIRTAPISRSWAARTSRRWCAVST